MSSRPRSHKHGEKEEGAVQSILVSTDGLDSEWMQLEKERREFEKEKEEWAQMCNKLEATQLSDPIVLDVGGAKFSCSKELLQKIPNSFFSALVSGRWEMKLQKDGSVFIDRSPTVFHLIMEYMRKYGTSFKLGEWLSALPKGEMMLLKEEALFYGLDTLVSRAPENGIILLPDQWAALHDNASKRVLLYDWNKERRSTSVLMERVAEMSNLLLIARLCNDTLVGAFTAVPWNFKPNKASRRSTDSFLFSISPTGAICKGMIKYPKYAFGIDGDQYGPHCLWFGLVDLRIQLTTGSIGTQDSPKSYQSFGFNNECNEFSELEVWSLS